MSFDSFLISSCLAFLADSFAISTADWWWSIMFAIKALSYASPDFGSLSLLITLVCVTAIANGIGYRHTYRAPKENTYTKY